MNQQGAVSTAGKRKKHVLLERASALEKLGWLFYFSQLLVYRMKDLRGRPRRAFPPTQGPSDSYNRKRVKHFLACKTYLVQRFFASPLVERN